MPAAAKGSDASKLLSPPDRVRQIPLMTGKLSKDRIVEAAVAILDTEGESALTFRAPASRLATGSGAIYWHVADKNELLAAASDQVIGGAMSRVVSDAEPREAIRAIALGLFDAIDAHPWVGAQSLQSGMVPVFEGIGGRLQALGVPDRALFDCWSALVNYILGVAGQNAANARDRPQGADRTDALGAIAARWARLDPATYPFMRRIAADLPGHDDREQFLAGIDLILAGILGSPVACFFPAFAVRAARSRALCRRAPPPSTGILMWTAPDSQGIFGRLISRLRPYVRPV